MALGFFYRRQKLVFIIMAVLMVSFLIGYQGLNLILGPSEGSSVAGRLREGRVTGEDIRAAQYDLGVLGDIIWGRGEELMAYMALTRQPATDGGASLAYAMLLKEADATGTTVTEADVDAFLAARGVRSEEQKSQQLARLRSYDSSMTEERLRGLIARWVGVYKTYRAARALAAPSPRELEHAYRDTSEKVRLRVAEVPAERFLDDARRDTALAAEAEIAEQFAAYRDRAPGAFDAGRPVSEAFGFGYLRPQRVSLLYATIRRNLVRQMVDLPAVMTGESRVQRDRDVQALLDQAAGSARELMTKYAELRRQFAAGPGRRTCASGLSLLGPAGGLATGMARSALSLLLPLAVFHVEAQLPLYLQAGVVRPAEPMLNRRLRVVNIDGLDVLEATRTLAERAGSDVELVFLPGGLRSIDYEKKVTLVETDLTLGEALERVIAQVIRETASPETRPETQPATRPAETDEPGEKLPPPLTTWVTVEGFGGVLVPVGGEVGLSQLPVGPPRQTPLVTAGELRGMWEFAFSQTEDQRGIVDVAFRAAGLVGDPNAAAIREGEDGPVLSSPYADTVWRLVEASPAHAPERLTPRLRMDVLRDLAVRRAMALAAERAGELAEQVEASEGGMQTEPLAAKLGEVHVTESFARKTMPYQWTPMSVLLPEGAHARVVARIPPAHLEEAMKAAFALVPEDVQGPYEGHPTAVLGVAPLRSALVMERIGYTPPARDEFEQRRAELAAQMANAPMAFEAAAWFSIGNVKARTGFTPEQ